MQEKRLQLRYRPGPALTVEFVSQGKSHTCKVGDLSHNGCMLVLPYENKNAISINQLIHGVIHGLDQTIEFTGRATHISITRGGMGVGLQLEGTAENRFLDLVTQISSNQRTGALRLTPRPDGLEICIHGYFGYGLDRDFLFFVRNRKISRINLTACRHIDSSGLGLLKIATENGIPIVGEHGIVAQMLYICDLKKPAYTASY